MNKLAQLLGCKNPQNLYNWEKSGKFNPDKNPLGKVILPKRFVELQEKGYQPLCWDAYQAVKNQGVEEVKIIDFYGIPVVFIK